jgi:hypothetical protein
MKQIEGSASDVRAAVNDKFNVAQVPYRSVLLFDKYLVNDVQITRARSEEKRMIVTWQEDGCATPQ